MFRKLAVKLTVFLLKRVDLPVEERLILTTLVLKRLAALPIHDIIVINEQGSLLVNGEQIGVDVATALRYSAKVALDNQALKLIRNQVLYTAIVEGVHKHLTPEDSFFSRAAIWWNQKELDFLKALAGEENGNSPLDGD